MNKETTPNVSIVRCHKCKHLELVNSEAVYAICRKTFYVFEPFQTDTRQHFCAFGESIHETDKDPHTV